MNSRSLKINPVLKFRDICMAMSWVGSVIMLWFSAHQRQLFFCVAALFFSALFLSAPGEAAEARFNALAQSDAHYLDYKASLCGYTLDDIQRMQGRLGPTRFFDATEKESWPEVYQVRVALIEQWHVDYQQFCR